MGLPIEYGAGAGGAIGIAGDKFSGKVLRSGLNKTFDTKESFQRLLNKMSNPESLGRYQGYFKTAAKRGTQGMQVTHHLLMQSDPEYRKIIEGDDDQ
mgnify:CR=1 FL=1